MAFDCLQGRRLYNLSDKPLSVVSQPNSKKVFPDVQREPPVFQFMPIASCPVSGHHWKERGCILFVPRYLQVCMYVDDVPSEPSLSSHCKYCWLVLPRSGLSREQKHKEVLSGCKWAVKTSHSSPESLTVSW